MTNQLIYTGKAKDIYTTEELTKVCSSKAPYDSQYIHNGAELLGLFGKACAILAAPISDRPRIGQDDGGRPPGRPGVALDEKHFQMKTCYLMTVEE